MACEVRPLEIVVCVRSLCPTESVPRQLDKQSGVPKEETEIWGPCGGERGLEFSRTRKGQFFFLHSLVFIT